MSKLSLALGLMASIPVFAAPAKEARKPAAAAKVLWIRNHTATSVLDRLLFEPSELENVNDYGIGMPNNTFAKRMLDPSCLGKAWMTDRRFVSNRAAGYDQLQSISLVDEANTWLTFEFKLTKVAGDPTYGDPLQVRCDAKPL